MNNNIRLRKIKTCIEGLVFWYRESKFFKGESISDNIKMNLNQLEKLNVSYEIQNRIIQIIEQNKRDTDIYDILKYVDIEAI